MELKFCPVTKSAATITKLYGKQPDGTWHTGCDIATVNVYSICNCVVTDISAEPDGTYIVTFQYDAERSFRYGNLLAVDVELGVSVNNGWHVGVADGHVHLEYCERSSKNCFPVRIGMQTYFKVDPLDVIAGQFSKSMNPDIRREYKVATHPNPDNLDPDTLDEMIIDPEDL